MLKIWGRDNAPNVRKVLWACEEIGLAYQRIDIGGRFGGLNDPGYRALNPNGLIPTMEDDGFVLWEAHAILRYLASGPRGPALLPEDRGARALVDQWMDWQAIHQAAAVRDLGRLLRLGAPAPNAERFSAARAEAERVFELIEVQLAQRPYIAGDAFTLADIPLAIGAARWFDLPVERPPSTALAGWFKAVSARPAYKAVSATPLAGA
ncbi:MAG: Glutathione S-transferase domain [Caulobacteraceae bacterium]|nr:Glutathione S-transferase domain [Caulobacteraceae bacterium]